MREKIKNSVTSTRNYLAIPVIALVLIVITTGTAFAYDGGGTRAAAPNRPAFAEMRPEHNAIREAVTNADYEAFKTAVATLPENVPHLSEIVDKASFMKLVEVHKLHEAGNDEAARTIMEEMGFKPTIGQGQGLGRGQGQAGVPRNAGRGDHMGQGMFDDENDSERADLLRRAHELRSEGDREGARVLFDQLRRK